MKNLKLRRHSYHNNLILPIIALLLICLGVGFAYVESSLKINGDFYVANNAWDIHFEKGYTVSEKIDVISEPTITNSTKISFNIKFNSIDSYYEIYPFVKNAGVVDARISNINYTVPGEIAPYIKFAITYADDTAIKEYDLLKAGDYEQLKIKVMLVDDFVNIWYAEHPEIGTSSEPEDVIANLKGEFSFQLDYVQSFGEGISRKKTTLIQSLGLENSANTSTPSFTTNPTSATSGLYVASETLYEAYPIYYYRGIVTNNNVLFANLCWKIVRTTETGGVKLVYNGNPTSTNQCTSTTNPTASVFTAYNNSLADVGYMYGTRYTPETLTATTSYIYGNDVLWDSKTGLYTLIKTATTTATATQSDGIQKHYTCLSSTVNTCSSVRYVYTYNGSTAYAYNLTNGVNIEEAKKRMFENETNSTILNNLNSWYETNILNKGYAGFIDDAIWCNDRTIVSGGLYSKDSVLMSNAGAYFASYKIDNNGRGLYDTTPNPAIYEKSSCPNINDQFTTMYSNTGNNKLKYSIGLLTADELTLAGSGYRSYDNSAYLRTGSNLWTMTPAYYGVNIAYNFYYNSSISPLTVSGSYYYKPSIVLRAYTKTLGGDGTTTNPYKIGN